MNKLPTKPILEEATKHILITEERAITTAEVNRKVANYLQIPQELLELEGSQGTGTEFSYRMCWIRSDLKKKGIIENPTRGVWKINSTIIENKGNDKAEIQTDKRSISVSNEQHQLKKGDIVRLLPDYCTDESEAKMLFRIIESLDGEKRAVITPIVKAHTASSVEYVEFDMITKA